MIYKNYNFNIVSGNASISSNSEYIVIGASGKIELSERIQKNNELYYFEFTDKTSYPRAVLSIGGTTLFSFGNGLSSVVIGVLLDTVNMIAKVFKENVLVGEYPMVANSPIMFSNSSSQVTSDLYIYFNSFKYNSYPQAKNLFQKPLNKTLILQNGEYKKYVKNKLTDTNSNSIVPIMTSNNSPSPFIITASATNGSDLPFKAFNNTLDTANRNYWYSGSTGNNHWLKVDTGEVDKYIVNSYSLNSFTTYRPTGWILEGSDDDTSWTTIDTKNSQTYADNTDAVFSFSNDIPYRYYRLTITKVNSTSTTVITPIISIFNLFGMIKTKVNNWQTVSSTLPTVNQFIEEGMDSLSPLLDRAVQNITPQEMTLDSTFVGEGNLFRKSVDLNKYFDLRTITTETRNS